MNLHDTIQRYHLTLKKQNKKQQKKPYETAMKDSEDDINKWKDSMCL